MADFLAENNSCGQTILLLVSRGNAIIAELLRLKDYIPRVYRLETELETQKYGEIIMDFAYLKSPELQEKKIENNQILRDRDEEFRDNNLEIIKRFYLVFESIHCYITDLNQYLEELEEGQFIHQSMETVFLDFEGKQLLCEALYLYGLMLLIVDAYIEGPIRERLLFSYYRYTPQRRDTESSIDEVCKLLRDTGYHSNKRPVNYPEDYFSWQSYFARALQKLDPELSPLVSGKALLIYQNITPSFNNTRKSGKRALLYLRHYKAPSMESFIHFTVDETVKWIKLAKRIPINKTYIDLVIGRLRSDDIYGQISVYPLPKHRSTALANQAAMLYVCLFFSTSILHAQSSIMREVVDKYFPDNWIISLYMGYIVNLAETWEHFKSAKIALNNTLEATNIKHFANSYIGNILPLLKTTENLLSEGNITKDTLLKNINGLINTLRECNVTLRWLILHTIQKPGMVDKNKKLKQLRDMVVAENNVNQNKIFKLLLNTAQLELFVKDTYKELFNEKGDKWENLKQESHKSLLELSEVFSGTKALTRIKKNENLQHWFTKIASEMENLNKDETSSSRKLVQLIQALEEVQSMHQLDSNMQVVQFLTETRNDLNQMIRLMNIKEDVLINLQIIGDISYAWELVDFYTNIMQNGIKTEPTLVIKLRAVFLKLSSALELPLLRINQAHSEDLISVSQYYSHELESYVRKVLQIIPSTMFAKMARIIQMQTSVIKELPTRVDKVKLKEFAQLDERFEFAELTHSVSIFSQGMRMMKSSLVGVVHLDPKKLLEDGIRKELVQHIALALHNELIFSPKLKPDELLQKLEGLGKIMDGYKRSFEYIQDYVNINGLKIWQEEVTRMINYNVEQECNSFLRNKVHPWQSKYQSRYIPIPTYISVGDGHNFVGRLAKEIIRLTDAKTSLYLQTTSSWYELKSHKTIFTKETIALIARAIEVAGLVGLDRLFSFMIITEMKNIVGYLENKNTTSPSWLNVLSTIHSDIKQSEENIQNPQKTYQNYINRTTKIWTGFLDKILLVGQLQLLRNLIAYHLNKACKFNARNLEGSMRAVNKSLLLDIKENKSQPSEELLYRLSEFFDYAGLNEPLNKIYVTCQNNEDHAITLFIFVIAHLQKMFLPQNISSLSKRNVDQMDGVCLSLAVHTTLRQFHSDVNRNFIRLACQYVFQIFKSNGNKKELQPEVIMMLNFLDCYTDYSEESRTFYREFLPQELLHLFQSLMGIHA